MIKQHNKNGNKLHKTNLTFIAGVNNTTIIQICNLKMGKNETVEVSNMRQVTNTEIQL